MAFKEQTLGGLYTAMESANNLLVDNDVPIRKSGLTIIEGIALQGTSHLVATGHTPFLRSSLADQSGINFDSLRPILERFEDTYTIISSSSEVPDRPSRNAERAAKIYYRPTELGTRVLKLFNMPPKIQNSPTTLDTCEY